MFLLILLIPWCCFQIHITLHSTMFLLIRQCRRQVYRCEGSLHSTMFLLIQTTEDGDDLIVNAFTFHYVSINTAKALGSQTDLLTLHSTMFLLIQRACQRYKGTCDFTFHYVSINTWLPRLPWHHPLSLHSTMFLLIPAPLNHRLILPYYTIFCRP